jgi:hypothetical protein
MSLGGHEEGGAVGEVLTPCYGAFLGNVMSHRAGESPHTLIKGGGTRRGRRSRVGRDTPVEAAWRTERSPREECSAKHA